LVLLSVPVSNARVRELPPFVKFAFRPPSPLTLKTVVNPLPRPGKSLVPGLVVTTIPLAVVVPSV
jgi:hypothetical protein